jgi:biofilm protein TabA
MILDNLDNSEAWLGLHPGFAKAFEFLRRKDLGELEPGIHELDGEEIYASIQKGSGKAKSDALLEAHRKYIDIQFLINGAEQTGWKAREDCHAVHAAYDGKKDIEFFDDAPQTYLQLKAGMFAIFFPADAHAPMISDGVIHKCVVKVRAL